MIDFQKKKKIRKIIYSPLFIFILLFIFVFMLRGVIKIYNKNTLTVNNLNQEKIEIDKLKEREERLNTSIEYLKTDQGVENEIRVKFRAVREGEEVSVIIDDIKKEISTTTVDESKKGFWYYLINN